MSVWVVSLNRSLLYPCNEQSKKVICRTSAVSRYLIDNTNVYILNENNKQITNIFRLIIRHLQTISQPDKEERPLINECTLSIRMERRAKPGYRVVSDWSFRLELIPGKQQPIGCGTMAKDRAQRWISIFAYTVILPSNHGG